MTLQYSPDKHVLIQYGSKEQTVHTNKSLRLDPTHIKKIQSIVGSFLYYARALNYTLLPTINEASSTQAKPTEFTKEEY